jgi:hypothetical protein
MLYGGTAIQQGLRDGVLDELQLHVVPYCWGEGAGCWGVLARRRLCREEH